MDSKESGYRSIIMLCSLSSQATKEFPANSSQEFTVKLPFTFHLNENWEVCLIGISIPKISSPPAIETSTPAMGHIRFHEDVDDDDEMIDVENEDTPRLSTRQSFQIPLKAEDSGKIIIEKYINPVFSQYKMKAYVNDDGYCQLEGVKGQIISFPTSIRKLLGWTDDIGLIHITRDDGVVTSPNPVVSRASFFHVGSDMVVNGFINSMRKPLLHINLPIEKDNSTIKNQVWIPLASTQFSTISIYLIDENLRPLSFETGLTRVSLQFRRTK